MLQLEDIKKILFEIYVAGFKEGYIRSIDVVTSYENWWEDNVVRWLDGN